MGENTSPEVAAMRILEALCVSQGWDVAVKWEVNAEEKRLEFCYRVGRCRAARRDPHPGEHGADAGRWRRACRDEPGRMAAPVWITDLASLPSAPASQSALRHEMVSGWAVPVRVGNRVLAVLEFYCHFRLREDREAMAAVETVAASLGQMLARSQESGPRRGTLPPAGDPA